MVFSRSENLTSFLYPPPHDADWVMADVPTLFNRIDDDCISASENAQGQCSVGRVSTNGSNIGLPAIRQFDDFLLCNPFDLVNPAGSFIITSVFRIRIGMSFSIASHKIIRFNTSDHRGLCIFTGNQVQTFSSPPVILCFYQVLYVFSFYFHRFSCWFIGF